MITGVDYRQRSWEDVSEQETIPTVRDEISYRRVIMNPATTGDYFPGHHDPDYARSQGQPTIYVNTMHFLGFIDRLVTSWAGPRTFITRRRVAMRQSVYAGDTMVGEGRVTAKRVEEHAGRMRHLVDVEVVVRNQHGAVCCPATVTVELPSRQTA